MCVYPSDTFPPFHVVKTVSLARRDLYRKCNTSRGRPLYGPATFHAIQPPVGLKFMKVSVRLVYVALAESRSSNIVLAVQTKLKTVESHISHIPHIRLDSFASKSGSR
ncbi:hypothetical protein AOLI_G00263940 [Acnodon oligacanthus]